jgi:hypothetical protein
MTTELDIFLEDANVWPTQLYGERKYEDCFMTVTVRGDVDLTRLCDAIVTTALPAKKHALVVASTRDIPGSRAHDLRFYEGSTITDCRTRVDLDNDFCFRASIYLLTDNDDLAPAARARLAKLVAQRKPDMSLRAEQRPVREHAMVTALQLLQGSRFKAAAIVSNDRSDTGPLPSFDIVLADAPANDQSG